MGLWDAVVASAAVLVVWCVVLGEVAWNGLPEWVRVPYLKMWRVVLDRIPE